MRTRPSFEHVKYLWQDEVADRLGPVDRLVYRSNKLGEDLTLTNTGGGNTSSKLEEPFHSGENAEPWLDRERFAWTLVGAGCIMWGIGECFWRYFLALGQNPFPSIADLGYSSFPVLVFLGLLLQPSSGTGRRRSLVLLDSLISMGAILAIAWFLLLGALAQAPGEANLAKFLGLYYPTTDMALLSCVEPTRRRTSPSLPTSTNW